jgi:hypothetical protein
MRSDDGGSSTQIAESSDRGMAPSLSPRTCADGTSTATERLPGTTAQRHPRSAGLRYGVSRSDYVSTIYERTDRRGLAWPTVPPGCLALSRLYARRGAAPKAAPCARFHAEKSANSASLAAGRSTLPPTRRVMPWRRLVYAGYRPHGLSKLRRSQRGLGLLPRVFGNSLLVRGDSAGRTDRAARTRRSTGIRARPRA